MWLHATCWYQERSSTDRVGDEAAAPILDFGEDVAWHQAGGGAAQDDVLPHETLDVLEDALLDLQLLKYTLLEHTHTQRWVVSHLQKYSVLLLPP